MKKLIRKIVAAAALLTGSAFAGEITEDQARAVAFNFAATDSTLKNRTVDAVMRRGSLFIVSLKPAGYIAVSANDAAFPVPIHSEHDFVEPEEGSLQQLFLAAKDEDIREAEGNRYANHWSRLLGTRKSLRMTTLSVQSDFDTVADDKIELHLGAYWNQFQPYNDFSPMLSSSSVNEKYRGRYYAGCASIAYAQVMKFWQWPELLDVDVEATMPLAAGSGDTDVTMRIKAGSRFDWASMRIDYPMGEEGVWDLRGQLSEAERLEIGRGVALSTVLSKAKFFFGGTGADLGVLTRNNWYTETVRVTPVQTGWTEEELFADIKSILQDGCPIPFSIKLTTNDEIDDGHAVVGVGWKKENNVNYIKWNMGWGYDDWVAYAGNEIRFKGYFKNHKPRPRPLMASVPVRSTSPVTLKWYFPKKGWTGDLTGFTVLKSEYSQHKGTWTDGFDSTQGESSGAFLDSFYTGQFTNIGSDSSVLSVRPSGLTGQEAYYTWTQPKSVTVNSTLTFDYRSIRSRNFGADVQVNPNDTGWETVFTLVSCDASEGEWVNGEAISLAKYAGKNLKFRIRARSILASNRFAWTDSGARAGYVIDNFAVTDTDVVDAGAETEIAVSGGADARSVEISSGLEVGHRYSFRIRPNLTSGKGEVGDYVAVDIVSTGLAAPSFNSVSSVSTSSHTGAQPVKEGLFRECGYGLNYLDVRGSSTMTQLRGYSSHPSILPDSAITTKPVPNAPGRFLVTVNTTSFPSNKSRQRIILTLVGENDNGAVVQKDLTLRVSTQYAAESALNVSDLDVGGGEDPGEDPDDPIVDPDDPDEPVKETPVVTTTFPKADDAGPNDDTTAKTRFCPGVKNTSSGVYDVTRTGSYNYLIPSGHNLLYWWIDRYKTAHEGALPNDYVEQSTPGSSDSTYTLQSYTYGLIDKALKTTLPVGTERTKYFPTAMNAVADWQDNATSDDDKLKALGRHIYAALANGPVGIHISTFKVYGAVIWGCEYAESSDGNYATALYITDTVLNTRTDTAVRKELKMTSNNYNSGAGLLNFNSSTSGIIESLYPISGPEPESTGDGEVTVKVTAGGKEFDISKVFSKVEKGAGNTITYTLDGTPGKKIDIDGEQISIQPEFANDDNESPFEIQDGKFVFKVKSIPGLKYQVLASDSLDPDSFTPAGKEREATGTRRELTVTRSGETKGFFKVRVSR